MLDHMGDEHSSRSSQRLHVLRQLILRSHPGVLSVIGITIALALTRTAGRTLHLRALTLAQHHLTRAHVIHGLRVPRALLHSRTGHAHGASHGASRSRRPHIGRRASHLGQHLLGSHGNGPLGTHTHSTLMHHVGPAILASLALRSHGSRIGRRWLLEPAKLVGLPLRLLLLQLHASVSRLLLLLHHLLLGLRLLLHLLLLHHLLRRAR